MNDEDIAKVSNGKVEVRTSTMLDEVISVDGSSYNNYRPDVYRFSSAVVVKEKINPYSNTESLDIIWRE